MSEFLSLETLATYGGALLATGLLVQLLKDIIKIETRLLSCMIALVVLNAAALGLGMWTWQGGILSVFNALIVGFAASGAYDAIQRAKSAGSNTEGNE